MASYYLSNGRALSAMTVLLTGWQPAAAATIVVDPGGTGDYPTIQAAITAARDGDEILLGDGVFRGDGNYHIDFLGKEITVRSSSGDPTMCVIDCEGDPDSIYPRPGFWFRSGEGPGAILEGVTVTHGWGDIGGAVLVAFSSPTIRTCIFRNNTAWQGGALDCQWSSSLIEDCVIVENSATRFPGGGIFVGEGNVVLRRCTIALNRSGVDAGGTREGGGIYVHAQSSSTVIVENCIVSHSTRGEGIYCEERSTATISCTDIFGNAGGSWVGSIADQAGMSGNLESDPLFCDNGKYTLTENSPCAPQASTCGLIGARGVWCGHSGIVESSWGRLKALYRKREPHLRAN